MVNKPEYSKEYWTCFRDDRETGCTYPVKPYKAIFNWEQRSGGEYHALWTEGDEETRRALLTLHNSNFELFDFAKAMLFETEQEAWDQYVLEKLRDFERACELLGSQIGDFRKEIVAHGTNQGRDLIQALKGMVKLWDAEHPNSPCGCTGASPDCPYPPPCELCVARNALDKSGKAN